MSLIYGVGKVAGARLGADGFQTIGDLQRGGERALVRRYGAEGARLFRLARGLDARAVRPEREAKSVSTETTFEHDIADFRTLEIALWRLTEALSARLKESKLAGSTIRLKLKSNRFQIRTRAQSVARPTQLAYSIFAVGRELLTREVDGTRYRLLGIGVSSLDHGSDADTGDLIDRRFADAEHAVDRLREKFGENAIVRGLALGPSEKLNQSGAAQDNSGRSRKRRKRIRPSGR